MFYSGSPQTCTLRVGILIEVPDGPRYLVGMTSSELKELAVGMGEKPFRGAQLADWIYRKAVLNYEEMTNLPAAFIAQLQEAGITPTPLRVVDHRRSTDDVDKLLMDAGDGNVFESVLLPYEDRVSCCLSSQVGCPMGCTFCATGLGGFTRNLSAGEIVGQYLALQSLSPRRVSHVVFMGMGEPLLNYDNLLAAIRLLHDEVKLSLRHITVSTVGLVTGIERLAKEEMPIHLALSLHSPLDDVRDRLMPVNQKWPVQVVVQAMRDYHAITGRKVTFEYLLIHEVNDTPEQADALADLVKGLPCVVNLIPFNYVDTEHGFARPHRERVRQFKGRLAGRGVNVTERVERGHDIAAACGQLAGQHQGKFARRGGVTSLPVSS